MRTIRNRHLPLALFLTLLLLPLGVAADTLAVAPPPPGPLELVETFPLETTLGRPDLPEAHSVWLDMIDGAEKSLSFEQFYATSVPDSRLEPVMAALARAAKRGVAVRFLVDAKFYEKEKETTDRLRAIDGLELRLIDVGSTMGGVQHSKFFVVDNREAFLGSQNFDWRALTHNHEMGLRIRVPVLVQALSDVFETDWAIAGGDPKARVKTLDGPTTVTVGEGEGAYTLTPAMSPKDWLPDETLWDLPMMLDLIASAKETVRVQVMGYGTKVYGGGYFDDLDRALRTAAARGVKVELLVANWNQKSGPINDLKSLQVLRNVSVRIVSLQEHSDGFIPYSRVIHSKYMVVDGKDAWLGTSNWKGGYFHASRNVGVILKGGPIPTRLDRLFRSIWTSDYAAPVNPCKRYPKVKRY